jgi:hypothetical protein
MGRSETRPGSLPYLMADFRQCQPNTLGTVEFEIGFSSEHSMIFIFDPHFMRTSPLWLVCSQTPEFAYLPAAREVKTSCLRILHVAGHRRHFCCIT